MNRIIREKGIITTRLSKSWRTKSFRESSEKHQTNTNKIPKSRFIFQSNFDLINNSPPVIQEEKLLNTQTENENKYSQLIPNENICKLSISDHALMNEILNLREDYSEIISNFRLKSKAIKLRHSEVKTKPKRNGAMKISIKKMQIALAEDNYELFSNLIASHPYLIEYRNPVDIQIKS